MHSSRMRTVRCRGRLGGGGWWWWWSGWWWCLYRGVSAYGGVHLPPTVDRKTDACENITFQQLLLRMVTTLSSGCPCHGLPVMKLNGKLHTYGNCHITSQAMIEAQFQTNFVPLLPSRKLFV